MNILIACEESQRVCAAFRERERERVKSSRATFSRAAESIPSGTYKEMSYHC